MPLRPLTGGLAQAKGAGPQGVDPMASTVDLEHREGGTPGPAAEGYLHADSDISQM